jgi:hypothetical protein
MAWTVRRLIDLSRAARGRLAAACAPKLHRSTRPLPPPGSKLRGAPGLRMGARRPLLLVLLGGTTVAPFLTHRVPHPSMGPTARPTAAQLAWMELELGAMINYGIGMPNAPWAPPNTTCFGNFSAPPAALFNSTPDFAQWTRAFEALGAKYSVIAASGGCGYALWPSRARFPDGTAYNYSTAQSPLLGTSDIMRSYVDAMQGAGIGTGVYFQLEYDYWGCVRDLP